MKIGYPRHLKIIMSICCKKCGISTMFSMIKLWWSSICASCAGRVHAHFLVDFCIWIKKRGSFISYFQFVQVCRLCRSQKFTDSYKLYKPYKELNKNFWSWGDIFDVFCGEDTIFYYRRCYQFRNDFGLSYLRSSIRFIVCNS